MAKQKRERALFELLAKERARTKAEPDTQARSGDVSDPAVEPTAPRTRIAGPGWPEQAAEPAQGVAPAGLGRKPLVTVGGAGLGVHHLVIAGVVLVCLCYLFYLLGARFAAPDDGLPDVPEEPTMGDVRSQQPQAGLVGPGPGQPPLGRRTAPPTEPTGRQPTPQPEPRPTRPGPAVRGPTQPTEPTRPREPEPRPAPAGPQYRVRIQRLDVSQPDAIDALRAFLTRSGIETDLETRSGYHVLYSRKRFTEKQKADELADQINKSLAAFEKETARPTSKDAYTVQVKGE
ncbi:MAG: hypothetical protein ISS74_08925 [Planctomycetes bacterium]|nr:hypothetical protein [Planctomycetota bacterium]